MKTRIRLLKPFMARPVGTVITVGKVEADLLEERGAAEILPADGAPPGPPNRTSGLSAPPQTRAVPNPARNTGAPPRGRLLPQGAAARRK